MEGFPREKVAYVRKIGESRGRLKGIYQKRIGTEKNKINTKESTRM